MDYSIFDKDALEEKDSFNFHIVLFLCNECFSYTKYAYSLGPEWRYRFKK